MKTKILLTVLFTFLSSQVWAIGDEKENGGDVITCGDGSSGYELLDLYEAKVLHHLPPVPAKSATLGEIFEERMKSLEGIDGTRAALYRDYMKSFTTEARFVPESDFTDIPDEGFKAAPAGCTLRQIVVQYDIPTPDGIRYMVNQDLWSHLNEENRAGLLIHEFMYREGRQPQNNFRTSSGVRYFNALVHSAKMPSITMQDYIQQLRSIGYQEVVVQNEPIVLFTWSADKTTKTPQPVDFHPNGKVGHATLASHLTLPGVGGGTFTCRQEITQEHSVYFFESGAVSTIHLGCGNASYLFHAADIEGFVFASTFTYDDGGHIYNIFADNSQGHVFRYWSSKVHIDGLIFQSPNFTSVTFYENGMPSAVSASSTDRWFLERKNQNQWQSFTPQPSGLEFTRDGDIQILTP